MIHFLLILSCMGTALEPRPRDVEMALLHVTTPGILSRLQSVSRDKLALLVTQVLHGELGRDPFLFNRLIKGQVIPQGDAYQICLQIGSMPDRSSIMSRIADAIVLKVHHESFEPVTVAYTPMTGSSLSDQIGSCLFGFCVSWRLTDYVRISSFDGGFMYTQFSPVFLNACEHLLVGSLKNSVGVHVFYWYGSLIDDQVIELTSSDIELPSLVWRALARTPLSPLEADHLLQMQKYQISKFLLLRS